MEEDKKQKHIVLIHGAGHGAWCWYKVATQLRSQGLRVTALDMAAAGVNTQPLSELSSYSDYSRPLMEFFEALPPEEPVVLVGHSMGGVCISLAMEKFPHKISVAVFVTAVMPGPNLTMQDCSDQYKKQVGSAMDCQWAPTCFLFGPEFLASRLYPRSPLEDLFLATSLVRPVGFFKNNIEFSVENYCSVRRVYVIVENDDLSKKEFQGWMIHNNPPDEVKRIHGSDHMFMLSKPQEFCILLQEIIEKYC